MFVGDGESKSEDRLDYRPPARHTCGIRSKGSAIGNPVIAHRLTAQPHSLRWKGMPFDAAGVLPRAIKLSKNLRATAKHVQLPRNDKVARRQFKAVVESRRQWKRSVGDEVVQPAKVVLPIDCKSVPVNAAVYRIHAVVRVFDS